MEYNRSNNVLLYRLNIEANALKQNHDGEMSRIEVKRKELEKSYKFLEDSLHQKNDEYNRLNALIDKLIGD